MLARRESLTMGFAPPAYQTKTCAHALGGGIIGLEVFAKQGLRDRADESDLTREAALRSRAL